MTGPRISFLPGEGLSFARHAPDPALAEHVEFYWTVDVHRPPATVDLVPDGLVDVTFRYLTGDGEGEPAAFVTGPMTGHVRYRHDRPVHLLGVGLRPGSALPLLGVPVAALPPEWSPLDDVIGPVGSRLAARVLAEPTLPGRLAALDTFLLARADAAAGRRDGRLDDRVDDAVRHITHRTGDLAVTALAHDVATSPRTLGRLFDDWIGMGPKRFARIVRAQAALRRLAEDPGTDLASLAADLGYADQAALSRELRALAGSTPRGLAVRLAADPHMADLFKPGPGAPS